MTRQEAEKVAKVLATADGECPVCAENLANEMTAIFPEHPWRELVGKAGGWDFDDD